MLDVYFYEEVVYDLYKLENKGEIFGLGRISKFDKSMILESFLRKIKEKLNMKYIRVVGNFSIDIMKVVVVIGVGLEFVKKVKR